MEINHLILFGQNVGIFGLIFAAYPTPHIGLVWGASGHCHISGHDLHNIFRLKYFFFMGTSLIIMKKMIVSSGS